MEHLKTYKLFENFTNDTIIVYGSRRENKMPYDTSIDIYQEDDTITLINAHNGAVYCTYSDSINYELSEYGKKLSSTMGNGFIDEKSLSVYRKKYVDFYNALKEMGFSITNLSDRFELGKRY